MSIGIAIVCAAPGTLPAITASANIPVRIDTPTLIDPAAMVRQMHGAINPRWRKSALSSR
ncbi:MAG TPA: hypothetical protein VJM13_10590 [Sphingopyxis sp.]|nr:hypothetical protein [Sphingopyxis sp.]